MDVQNNAVKRRLGIARGQTGALRYVVVRYEVVLGKPIKRKEKLQLWLSDNGSSATDHVNFLIAYTIHLNPVFCLGLPLFKRFPGFSHLALASSSKRGSSVARKTFLLRPAGEEAEAAAAEAGG